MVWMVFVSFCHMTFRWAECWGVGMSWYFFFSFIIKQDHVARLEPTQKIMLTIGLSPYEKLLLHTNNLWLESLYFLSVFWGLKYQCVITLLLTDLRVILRHFSEHKRSSRKWINGDKLGCRTSSIFHLV